MRYFYPYFTNGEIEAQEVTCPRSQSQWSHAQHNSSVNEELSAHRTVLHKLILYSLSVW